MIAIIVLIVLIISIIGCFLGFRMKYTFFSDVVSGTCILLFSCSLISCFFLAGRYIYVNNEDIKSAKLIAYQQRYAAINYAMNNDSLNIVLLTDEISKYNSDVLLGRIRQSNKWICIFDYDFYNDLELIELD